MDLAGDLAVAMKAMPFAEEAMALRG